ncbi:hypothetical protein ABIF74_008990 [Bradyrhizobium japonicum]
MTGKNSEELCPARRAIRALEMYRDLSTSERARLIEIITESTDPEDSFQGLVRAKGLGSEEREKLVRGASRDPWTAFGALHYPDLDGLTPHQMDILRTAAANI